MHEVISGLFTICIFSAFGKDEYRDILFDNMEAHYYKDHNDLLGRAGTQVRCYVSTHGLSHDPIYMGQPRLGHSVP